MKKLTILIDMDGILVDLQSHIIERYNHTFHRGNNIASVDDITNWNYERCLRNGAAVLKWFKEPDFFYNLKPIPGAIEAVERLAQKHHVVILSSPSGPYSAMDKLRWLSEKMPFLNRRNIMLAHLKHLVKGDVLIDDSPDNIHDYNEHWPDALTCAIKYPYNSVSEPKIMADSYKDYEGAWNTIEEAINRYAES